MVGGGWCWGQCWVELDGCLCWIESLFAVDGQGIDSVVGARVEGWFSSLHTQNSHFSGIAEVAAFGIQRDGVGFFPCNKSEHLKSRLDHRLSKVVKFPKIIKDNSRSSRFEAAVHLLR